MPLDLARLKQIDQSSISLVSGYTKTITSADKICPKEIINIIVLFAQILERFIKSADIIEISSKQNIIGMNDIATYKGRNENISRGWYAIYGELDICCKDKTEQNYIYEWTLSVNTNRVSIGLITHRNVISEYCFGGAIDGNYYAIGDTGCLEWQNANSLWDITDMKSYSDVIKKGDEIKMIFDASKGILSYHKNGKDLGIAYDNVDISKTYCMALAVRCYPGEYIEIMDFCVKSPFE